jgi:hypothetical protein
MAESKKQSEIKDITTDSTNPIEIEIYKHYSPNKQNQDLMWTNYHRTNLVAQGVTDVESKVVGMVLAVQGGKKLSTVLKDVDEKHKVAFEKLVKVGLRTAWAESCIEEGLSAMAEGREPIYPQYPSI